MVVIRMKVSGSNFQKVLSTYQMNRPQRVGGTEAVRQSDRVNLSSGAKEISRVHEILAQTPDVRADRVAHLKMAIAQGTYEVKGDKIAEKMIEHHLIDTLK